MILTLNEKIQVEIQRKNVKRVNILIKWNGKVRITAPHNIDENTIKTILQKKSRWIEDKLETLKEYVSAHPMPVNFSNNETIWLLGKPLILQVREGKKEIIRDDGKLIIQVEKVEKEKVRKVLIEYMRNLAEKIINLKAEELSEITGIKPQKIEIRDWKRKWGLCKISNQTLVFNWRSVQLPEELINYIIAHEIAHFKYIKHNKKFWNYLQYIIPESQHHKEELKSWISTLLW
jgi:predicted metal-dependent hydrolase